MIKLDEINKYGKHSFICDSSADVANLPTSKTSAADLKQYKLTGTGANVQGEGISYVKMGADAFIIETQSIVFLKSDDTWV